MCVLRLNGFFDDGNGRQCLPTYSLYESVIAAFLHLILAAVTQKIKNAFSNRLSISRRQQSIQLTRSTMDSYHEELWVSCAGQMAFSILDDLQNLITCLPKDLSFGAFSAIQPSIHSVVVHRPKRA